MNRIVRCFSSRNLLGAAVVCAMLQGTIALSPNVASSAHAADANPAAATPEVGIWYDDTGRGAVEIAPCGQRFCGRIVWLKDPLNKDGRPLRDVYNPEPSRRNQAICGLQVLGQLSRQPDGSLDGGWVYDPKVGQSYNVEIRQNGTTELAVHGYLNMKLFGKTLTWRRAPADLKRCEGLTRASAN